MSLGVKGLKLRMHLQTQNIEIYLNPSARKCQSKYFQFVSNGSFSQRASLNGISKHFPIKYLK